MPGFTVHCGVCEQTVGPFETTEEAIAWLREHREVVHEEIHPTEQREPLPRVTVTDKEDHG